MSLILCSDSVANILFVARFDKKKFLFLCYFSSEVSILIVYCLVSCENVWYLFSLLISFFNLFWMMISRKLANLFEKFWLSWHLSMLMFRFYPSVFDLLIAIDAWFEMIYVKYKNIFFRITYQFTLWGVFCACWTHRFWKVYPNPMQPWSGVQSCYFFAH